MVDDNIPNSPNPKCVHLISDDILINIISSTTFTILSPFLLLFQNNKYGSILSVSTVILSLYSSNSLISCSRNNTDDLRLSLLIAAVLSAADFGSGFIFDNPYSSSSSSSSSEYLLSLSLSLLLSFHLIMMIMITRPLLPSF